MQLKELPQVDVWSEIEMELSLSLAHEGFIGDLIDRLINEIDKVIDKVLNLRTILFMLNRSVD